MKNLPEKYRPQQMADLIGQGLTPTVLQRMADRDTVPTGLLFSGASGTGKTSAARILASLTSSELLELDAGLTGSATEMRSLTEQLRHGSKKRLVILDEAHSISKEGFNALLKSLEDPPQGVTYVLATTEPHRIPETIKTRTVEFEFKRTTEDDIQQFVSAVATKEDFPISPELAAAIAETSNGSLRKALNQLQHCIIAEMTTEKQYRDAVGITDYGAQLLVFLTQDKPELTDRAITLALQSARTPAVITQGLINALRDVQIIRAKGTPTATGAALAIRKQAAAAITADAAFQALMLIWQFQNNFAGSQDPETDIRLLCSMLERTLQA